MDEQQNTNNKILTEVTKRQGRELKGPGHMLYMQEPQIKSQLHAGSRPAPALSGVLPNLPQTAFKIICEGLER